MISPEVLSKDEYEMQYYGFSTTQFLEDFKDIVKQCLQNTLTNLEKQLCTKETDKEVVKEGIDQLYSWYLISLNNALKKLEIESRNIFAIPDNVLLEEDKLKCPTVTDKELRKLQQDVDSLENKLKQEKLFLVKCQQAKDIYENTLDPIYKKMCNLTLKNRMNKQSKENQNLNKMLELFKHKVQQFTKTSEDVKGSGIASIHLQISKDFF